MTVYHKLRLFLEEELQRIHSLNPDLTLKTEEDRYTIAQYLSGVLIDDKDRYRSGRRISDRLRDTLIDIQKWWVRK